MRMIPSLCLLCGVEHGPRPAALCSECRADLPRLSSNCRGCGAALGAPGLCGRCQRQPPDLTSVVAAAPYRFPIDRLVQLLKYQRQLQIAALLGELLAVAAAGAQKPDLLVPVPVHRRRLIGRGFNQALEIARTVALHTGTPIAPAACHKIRASADQASLSAAARRRNLRGVFRASAAVAGLHVAVVDDVYTTGATLAAMAAALRLAGARRVDAWVVARTMEPFQEQAARWPLGHGPPGAPAASARGSPAHE